MPGLSQTRRTALPALIAALAVLIGGGIGEAAVSLNTLTGLSSSDLVAGKQNADYRVRFSTNVANATNAISVTFPAGYTVASSATVTDAAGLAGRVTLNGVSQPVSAVVTDPALRRVTIVLPAAVPLNIGINEFRIVSGVHNPTVSGTTGAIVVTTGASGETAASATVNIQPGVLKSVRVATSVAAATAGRLDVRFTTANPIPADGRILLVLPTGWVPNAGAGTAVVSDNIAPPVSMSISGQVVTLRLTGSTGIPAGQEVRFELSNLFRPSGSAGTFILQTQTAGGQLIDLELADLQQVGQVDGDGEGRAGKVSVCHKGRKTLSISANAWPAHQRHGDTLGACQ